MTVEELANKRYSGEFVFMLGHLEGITRVVRIAYFGTDGRPGHYAIPIRGKFTEEDIKVIESVDCDDFYKVFDVMRFKIAEFKG